MNATRSINIIEDVTRDGRYVKQYTPAETKIIIKLLEQAGVSYIEVGHGVGMNAWRNPKLREGVPIDDRRFMEVAAETLKQSKWGMFCIPGIARLDDIEIAGEYNMPFVRIGTNVTEVANAKPFIRLAKSKGMFVGANFMKSYAVTPAQFAEYVKQAEDYGADVVYLVDSAGSMFPRDLEVYTEAARRVTNVPMGFHGHNNRHMAMPNSLKAAELGYSFIDATLQGLGRSAGNTCTEALVMNLIDQGFETGIDLWQIIPLGQRFAKPYLAEKGYAALDMVAGHAGFHSSYMPHIEKCVVDYGVNPLKLIAKYCQHDRVHMDVGLLEKMAQELVAQGDILPVDFQIDFKYDAGEQEYESLF